MSYGPKLISRKIKQVFSHFLGKGGSDQSDTSLQGGEESFKETLAQILVR